MEQTLATILLTLERILLRLDEISSALKVDKNTLVQSTVRETEARILAEMEGEVITLRSRRGNGEAESTDGEGVPLAE